MRVHKIMLQALWHILLPHLYSYLEEHENELHSYLKNATESNDPYDYAELVSILLSVRFCEQMDAFLHDLKEDNPCAQI